jgi:hypothetical protein
MHVLWLSYWYLLSIWYWYWSILIVQELTVKAQDRTPSAGFVCRGLRLQNDDKDPDIIWIWSSMGQRAKGQVRLPTSSRFLTAISRSGCNPIYRHSSASPYPNRAELLWGCLCCQGEMRYETTTPIRIVLSMCYCLLFCRIRIEACSELKSLMLN